MYYLTGLDDLSDTTTGIAACRDARIGARAACQSGGVAACQAARQNAHAACPDADIVAVPVVVDGGWGWGGGGWGGIGWRGGRGGHGGHHHGHHGFGYLGVADATQMPCSELQERYTNAIEWMQTRSKGHAAEAKARAQVLAAEAQKRCGTPLTPVLPTSAPGAQQPIQQSFLETAATQGGAAVGSIIQQLQAAGQIPGGPARHEQPPQEEPAQIFGLNWKIVAGIGVAIGVGAFLLTRKKKA